MPRLASACGPQGVRPLIGPGPDRRYPGGRPKSLLLAGADRTRASGGGTGGRWRLARAVPPLLLQAGNVPIHREVTARRELVSTGIATAPASPRSTGWGIPVASHRARHRGAGLGYRLRSSCKCSGALATARQRWGDGLPPAVCQDRQGSLINPGVRSTFQLAFKPASSPPRPFPADHGSCLYAEATSSQTAGQKLLRTGP